VLRIGDRLGNARVIKISQYEVVLRGKNCLQTLKMYPDPGKPSSAADCRSSSGSRLYSKTEKNRHPAP
jgi:hypothetical protein